MLRGHGIQLGYKEGRPRTQNSAPLNDIFQLSDVAWPIIVQKLIHLFIVHLFESFTHLCRMDIKEIVRQERDILSSFPKGRHIDREDIEPIVKISPEITSLNLLFKVAVCGSD